MMSEIRGTDRMPSTDWEGWPVSRMMLGTAQLGMSYGVANQAGKPEYARARAMVEAAWEGGVNGFDTAAAYGDSEAVLGRILGELGIRDQALVVTKIRPLTAEEREDPRRAAQIIEQGVARSQRDLGLERLPVVLFHREADAARYLPVLEELRKAGRIGRIGSSCEQAPGTACALMARPEVSALQVAANVLDRRHEHSGLFSGAEEASVALFVRSAFLQGVLLMPENRVPQNLKELLPLRRRLQQLAGEWEMSFPELCIRSLLGLPGVTALVIGADSPEQVRINRSLFIRGALPEACRRALEGVCLDLPLTIVTPHLWSGKETADRL